MLAFEERGQEMHNNERRAIIENLLMRGPIQPAEREGSLAVQWNEFLERRARQDRALDAFAPAETAHRDTQKDPSISAARRAIVELNYVTAKASMYRASDALNETARAIMEGPFHTTQDMRIALSVAVLDEWIDDPEGIEAVLKIAAALIDREYAAA